MKEFFSFVYRKSSAASLIPHCIRTVNDLKVCVF